MADWDEDSPELRRNLDDLGRTIAAAAAAREPLSSEVIRGWHVQLMRELVPQAGFPVGVFRGEPGLETCRVWIGTAEGTQPGFVRDELAEFDRLLRELLDFLDQEIGRIRPDAARANDDLQSVLTLCAWAHGEWMRIHPFPNGNGRTARFLVNAIAVRYGLPAFMRLRPRPGRAYELVAQRAMTGDWRAAVPVCETMYRAVLGP